MSNSQLVEVPFCNKESALRTHNIVVTRAWLLLLPWLGFFAQVFIDSSYINVTCSALAATGSFLIFFDALQISRLYIYPLSTWVLVGFGVTLQLGPLLFTAIEGKPISYNLELPIEVLLNSFVVTILIILSHKIYRRSVDLAKLRFKVQNWLSRGGIFRPLSLLEALCMTLIGVFSLAFVYWFPNLTSVRVITKFVQGFQFLSIIPSAFFLQGLVRSALQANSIHPIVGRKLPLVVLGISTILIAIVSLGRGARGIFFLPIVSLLLGISVEWLFGMIRVRISYLLGLLLTLVFLLPLASDLATAIVMVRTFRGSVPAVELAQLTLDALQDRSGIESYRQRQYERLASTTYDESYVNNPLLSRFANLKYPDLSLIDASGIPPGSTSEKEYRKFQFQRMLVELPAPLLTLFGMSANEKDKILRPSWGDKLHGLSLGVTEVGGKRVTHFFGTGKVGFGLLLYVLIPISLLLPFSLIDAHSHIDMSMSQGFIPPRFSIVAITQLYGWLTFSNYATATDFLVFPIRAFIEPIILFIIVRWSLRFLYKKPESFH